MLSKNAARERSIATLPASNLDAELADYQHCSRGSQAEFDRLLLEMGHLRLHNSKFKFKQGRFGGRLQVRRKTK